MRRLLIVPFSLALLTLAATTANATVTVNAVTNASRFDNSVANVYTVYGGLAGALPGGDPGTIVNTCTGTPRLGGCNRSRITPNTVLNITFTATKAGIPVLSREVTGTSAQQIVLVNQQSTPIAANTQTTVQARWGDICAVLSTGATNTLDATCSFSTGVGAVRTEVKVGVSGGTTPNYDLSGADDDSASITFVVSNSIGQNTSDGTSIVADVCDSDPIGLCAWEVTAGDEKVVLGKLEGRQGFPIVSGTGLSFEKILLYPAAVSGNDASGDAAAFASINNAMEPKSVDVKSDGGNIDVTPTRIDGLINDQRYVFKVALQDGAGNIGYFTGDAQDSYCTLSTNPQLQTCHIATPGEVVGVLSKDLNCFIATAAYGSQLAPQVETFRRFRDLYLKPTQWGSKFVSFYYEHSPKYARIIADHPALRTLSRGALWPLLAYASLSLKIGALPAFFIALLLALLLITSPLLLLAKLRRPRA